MSSLDAVSLVMAVEDELGIEVGDDELKNLRTIDDLMRLLESKSGDRA